MPLREDEILELVKDWERLAAHLHGMASEREKGRGDGYAECARKLRGWLLHGLDK
jgi:hypothetical protein